MIPDIPLNAGVYMITIISLNKFAIFLWGGFEPRTLHLLCIVPANRAKLTRTNKSAFKNIMLHELLKK